MTVQRRIPVTSTAGVSRSKDCPLRGAHRDVQEEPRPRPGFFFVRGRAGQPWRVGVREIFLAVEPFGFDHAPRWFVAKAKSLSAEPKSFDVRANCSDAVAQRLAAEAKSVVVSPQRLGARANCLAGNPKSLAGEANCLVISPQCCARAPIWFDFSHKRRADDCHLSGRHRMRRYC